MCLQRSSPTTLRFDLDILFAGLFTQGMVCHSTYLSQDGQWLEPGEVIEKDGVCVERTTGRAVEVGPAIKMSKSKRNVVGLEGIIEHYGVDTARWFMLSDTPPASRTTPAGLPVRGVRVKASTW